MNKIKNITATLAAIALMTACTGEAPEPNTPLTVTADTRAGNITPTEAATIHLSLNGATPVDYTLATDGTFTGPDLFIAPGTNTLSIYAWGTVETTLGHMPVIYEGPTTPVVWSTTATPTLTVALTPATARVKVTVTGIPLGSASLYNISVPTTDANGIYQWTTTMPPTLTPYPGVTDIPLPIDGNYAQIMPGTVNTGQHLLTINGSMYIIARQPHIFLAGKDYELAVTINREGQPTLTNITITDYTPGDPINVAN